MNLDAIMAIGKSKSYTDESIAGGGISAGKNCQIKSITDIEGGHKVEFVWYLDNGTEKTGFMNVMDGVKGEDGEKGETGEQGRGIKHSYVNQENHFIIVYDDDVEEDMGEITVLCVDTLNELNDVEIEEPTDGQVLKYNAETEKWENGTGGGGGSAELSDDLTTAISVGGIDSGVTYEQGTSLETLFRDLLEPTLFPTLTNPSASMTATGAKLLEKGATLATTFTIAFNRGSINPQYSAESKYRSGEAVSYSLNGGTAQDGNTFNVTVTEAQKTYQGTVNYAQGVQPKDSKGKNYQSPLPAGSVNTGTISYEFVDALWANTSSIATVAKLALVSKSTKQKDFAFPAQTVANPEVFDVPASWTVTAVQVKNDLSGLYEDALSQFTVTDTSHNDASGTSVAYKRYTFNLGYDTGARSVRLKWS